MTLAKRMWMAVGVCAGTLLAAGTALAQEGEKTGRGTSELFKWINFVIVAALLLWLFAKKLPPIFRKNAEEVNSAISKAAAVKAEADAALREAERLLSSLDRKVDELRAEAQREMVAEAERIRAMTRSDVEKVAAAAKAEVEAAERAARNELKELAAKLAVDTAESQLATELTPAAHESLISGFVKSLAGRPN